ncbi:hypothetical protein D9619_009835 [Psilocybe cf. subviscida]|uniref:Uncharacterized protein n=1 Tax=Psilocybe cf. subviscida TaxID=2480587 RepID=A0A8H5F6F0_9AGAR|nr:hypothetical protein D9619_009835 [Psilocybe cf. subviscida]
MAIQNHYPPPHHHTGRLRVLRATSVLADANGVLRGFNTVSRGQQLDVAVVEGVFAHEQFDIRRRQDSIPPAHLQHSRLCCAISRTRSHGRRMSQGPPVTVNRSTHCIALQVLNALRRLTASSSTYLTAMDDIYTLASTFDNDTVHPKDVITAHLHYFHAVVSSSFKHPLSTRARVYPSNYPPQGHDLRYRLHLHLLQRHGTQTSLYANRYHSRSALAIRIDPGPPPLADEVAKFNRSNFNLSGLDAPPGPPDAQPSPATIACLYRASEASPSSCSLSSTSRTSWCAMNDGVPWQAQRLFLSAFAVVVTSTTLDFEEACAVIVIRLSPSFITAVPVGRAMTPSKMPWKAEQARGGEYFPCRADRDAVPVVWKDRHKSVYTMELLGRYVIPERPETFHDKIYLRGHKKMCRGCLLTTKYRVVFVRGVPEWETREKTCELRALAERFGETRPTFYVFVWDVVNLKECECIAFTNLDLGLELHMNLYIPRTLQNTRFYTTVYTVGWMHHDEDWRGFELFKD